MVLALGFIAIPVLGSVGLSGSDLFPVPEAPYNILPYLFLGYLTITCGWFFIQRIRSPHVVRSMEKGIAAIHAKFEA